ncbi:hypothetical protein IJI55_00095 [Candidatus Saccharibacteria bacterium]|nr:hypothetical protein [Candidatus Saccharibacteria bacterium]MBR3323801.1 hypothetical protein [Candidatus Saccharibacteria bacterium]
MPSVFFLLIAILLVGILVFVAIILTGKRTHDFDKEKYQVDFLKIENALTKEDASSHAMAIIEGDKLLDRAMMEMGVPGKTMGDRLKKVGSKFESVNSVWYVHKIRNNIAHEHGYKVDYNQAKHALNTYRKALKDLGAI